MSDTGAGLIFVGSLILALALVHKPLGDYLARVLTGKAAPAGRAGDLPGRRHRRRRRPDLAALPALGAGLQRGLGGLPLRLPAAAAPLLAAVRGAADVGGPVVEHRGQLRDEHQLAELLGRERPWLRWCRWPAWPCRTSSRPRSASRWRSRWSAASPGSRTDRLGNFWVDLTRICAAGAAADLDASFAVVFVGAGMVQNLHHYAEISTLAGGTPDAHRRPGRQPGGDQGDSAPTAAASPTPTPRTRSRTRPPGRTGWRSSCCCASRSRCPAPSAGWSATSARATRSSR